MSHDWHATYRLQLHAGFPFAAAAEVLPYLRQLGISHLYLSPVLQATPGSTHGYDVTDPTRVGEDLGGAAGWAKFCAAARDEGLGVLLDIVPNHMATAHNPWWEDLLAHGPASRYADCFDVFPNLGGDRWRLHLATLGVPYREALAQGQLQVSAEHPRPRLKCGGQSWPLNPASWDRLFASEAAGEKFASLVALAPHDTWDDESRAAYASDCAAAETLWAEHGGESQDHVAQLNRDPAQLHELIEAQHYALHHWRREGEVSNYRRFFDIGTLVGTRMERPEVFTLFHTEVARMARAGEIDGVRVDHPDGLAAPAAYFQRLRTLIPNGRIYVEKILENEEVLRDGWPVDGTVGYDFLGKVNRLWMDEQKADALSGIYADFTGHTVNLARVVREKKNQILEDHFSADLDRLALGAESLAREYWQTADLSPHQLRRALALVTVELPVYRTYRDDGPVDAADREALRRAFTLARTQGRDLEPAVFDFLEQVFLGEAKDEIARRLIGRWQQLTPAVTAKGIEDTTFYCYDRLVACNEVGAQASLLGISSDNFHQFCHHLVEHWPNTLLATSTHDTKRSEDVRARTCVLTEDTERWRAALQEWTALNAPCWQGREPDRHLEYLFYQTLVGAWPLSQERAWAYLLKAAREAKINTTWHNPNPAYELAIQRFVEGTYASAAFQTSLENFVRPLIQAGRINSLAQQLIKLTAPGVPDFYQGTELWDLSLVDPDNRRPVDFKLREKLLREIAGAPASEVWPERDDDGRAKLWLTARCLSLRRAHAASFARGSVYEPVVAQGLRMRHLLGFLRGGAVLTLVPRFLHSLRDDWNNTAVPLPAGTWKNWLTGAELTEVVPATELFRDFPVAVLVLQS
jgi:(1->4)-alpha-D-glucan 1-alpha-D-glucosylmutase